MLKVLTDENPTGFHTRKENNYPFVECAALADDIKYRGGSWQSDWHFIDMPWGDADVVASPPPPNPKNLTLVIPEIVQWLREEPGYRTTTVYKTMMRHNLSCSEEQCEENEKPYVSEKAA